MAHFMPVTNHSKSRTRAGQESQLGQEVFIFRIIIAMKSGQASIAVAVQLDLI